MANTIRAILVVTAIITATFLPFFPGGYDSLSKPLSGMAWIFGRVGLLLVPVGGLWLLFPQKSGADIGPRGWLVWLTLGACTLVAMVLILIAFASGPLLAAGTGAIAGLLIFRLMRHLQAASPMARTLPGLLVVAPITVLVVQLAFLEPIASRARNRVISNSAPLIAEIESYHARHGAYPVSIFALYGDVKPAVVGVQRYYYEPSGDAYNLIFEQPSPAFGLRRFVVYNPLDKQRLTVHETERLRLDDAGLDADNAGYTIVEKLPQPHWKLFTFRS
jgi:hypothetical protein